ncbi:MAG: flagellar hook protein FlgE [Proteobacteria bacterium]|nr:flagellar hook protein FlgE [Pseudomonadota bacterium]
MNSALFTGISGINANMSVLSVIGNNVANVNTTGFKGSRATFSDILSQSLTGNSQIGLGVSLSAIQKSFAQGAFETTGNILDMAVSGDGFFLVQDPALNSTLYTRAGQFSIDKNGKVVNPDGYELQGYLADTSGALQNTVADLVISTGSIAPNASTSISIEANLDSNAPITGFVFTTGSNEDIYFSIDGGTAWLTADLVTDGSLVSAGANTGAAVAVALKDALEAANGIADTYTVTFDDQTGLFTINNDAGNAGTLVLDWSHANTTSETVLGFTAASSGNIAAGASDTSDVAAGAFTLAKAGDTSNFTTPVTVYDSLGNAHVLTMYFRKDSLGATGNIWDWYATVPATDSTSGVEQIQASGTITFNTSGALYSESSVTYATGGFDFTGGAAQDQTISFNYGTSVAEGGTGKDGSTQYGTDSGISALTQDGYSSGTLRSISIGQDGVILGVYSNGRDLTLGQVLLASFASQEGLKSAGSNLYTETFNSGQPIVGSPGSSGRGLVQANTLELSNIDIAQQFVNMITAQRGFQASSRIITTTDELLAELVNLKR